MSESHYRSLVAWQRAIELVVVVYRVTSSFPSDERYGLVAQLRRAATSVPANIAEGRGRGTRRDYRHFLLNARGSLFELGTHIEVARRLDYLDHDAAASVDLRLAEVLRPLAGLIRVLGAGETGSDSRSSRV